MNVFWQSIFAKFTGWMSTWQNMSLIYDSVFDILIKRTYCLTMSLLYHIKCLWNIWFPPNSIIKNAFLSCLLLSAFWIYSCILHFLSLGNTPCFKSSLETEVVFSTWELEKGVFIFPLLFDADMVFYEDVVILFFVHRWDGDKTSSYNCNKVSLF